MLEHTADLRLLKHEFGDKRGVSVAFPPPGQIALVFGRTIGTARRCAICRSEKSSPHGYRRRSKRRSSSQRRGMSLKKKRFLESFFRGRVFVSLGRLDIGRSVAHSRGRDRPIPVAKAEGTAILLDHAGVAQW